MPLLKLNNLTPASLRQISPPLLFELLSPYAEFFRRSGYPQFPATPPAADDDTALDCDAVYRLVLSTEHDCPEKLDEALFFINRVADRSHGPILAAAAEKADPPLEFDEEASAADLAVLLWLRSPRLLEALHAEEHIDQERAHTFFICGKSQPPPLSFRRLTEEDLDRLGASLAPWFAKRGRGRACRVFKFERKDAIWFMIRHGDLVQRHATYSLKTHQESSSRFRPQVHDSIVFRPHTGELGICAPGLQLLREYTRLMGRVLFGDETYFRVFTKYSLEPLRAGPSCLELLSPDEDIAWASLTRVTFTHPGRVAEKVTLACSDVFDFLSRSALQIPPGAIHSATLRVQFHDGGGPRDFLINSASKARHFEDQCHLALEGFLLRRGFIVPAPQPRDDAPTQLDMVAV